MIGSSPAPLAGGAEEAFERISGVSASRLGGSGRARERLAGRKLMAARKVMKLTKITHAIRFRVTGAGR
jgi:hypothetical protein